MINACSKNLALKPTHTLSGHIGKLVALDAVVQLPRRVAAAAPLYTMH